MMSWSLSIFGSGTSSTPTSLTPRRSPPSQHPPWAPASWPPPAPRRPAWRSACRAGRGRPPAPRRPRSAAWPCAARSASRPADRCPSASLDRRRSPRTAGSTARPARCPCRPAPGAGRRADPCLDAVAVRGQRRRQRGGVDLSRLAVGAHHQPSGRRSARRAGATPVLEDRADSADDGATARAASDATLPGALVTSHRPHRRTEGRRRTPARCARRTPAGRRVTGWS
ncbi:MAG: hypothetical protein JWR27_65 [Aeromicrobium sp.]|nr:hypothetical protein [Aeromicrobium sp.]